MMGCQSSRPRDGVKHASMASAAGSSSPSSSSSSSRNRTMPQMSFGLGVHVGRAGNVDLSSRKMDFLGPRIIELIQQDTLHRKATSLTLTNNLLYTLGKELTLLPELEEIDMDANRFQRLPESLTHLPNLWRLNASANPLSAVTGFDMAPRLQALRALALRACSLSCVPARLAECVTLEELDLSDNAHMHVDAFDFAQLRYLRKLSVKNCGLHGDTLPRCLQASALYSLDISGNHFTFESPEFFGKVIPKTLHELHLCRMQLTSVPQAVIVLKRLYFLDLAENPIETLDVLAGRLVKRLPRVRSSASSLVNLDEDNNGNHSHSRHDDNNNGDNHNGDGHGAAAAAAVGRDDDNDDADSAASTGTRVSMSKVSKAGIVSTVTQPLQLRKLSLRACGLRTVPRYFHKMSSLEELDLSENDRLDDPNMTLFSLSQLRVLNITGCPFAVDPSSSKNEWFDIAKLRRLVDLQWELWRGPHNASLYRTRIPIEICGLPLERINEVALRPGLFVGDTVETAIALLRDGYYKVDFSMDDDTVLSYASALRVLLDAQDFFFPPEYTMHVMAATTSEGGGGHAGKGLLAAKVKLLHHLHEHYAGNVHLHHAPHLAHLLHRHTQQNNNSNSSNNAVTGSNDAVDAVSDGQQQQQPHDDAVTSVGADDGVASASTSPATAALQPQASGRSSGSGGNSGSGGCCTCSELGAAHLRIAVNRYIFFLAMQAANYDAVIIPPLDVMCMHLSQMTTSPLQYREDCEAICGRILNCNYRNFFIESERQPAAARDAIAASRKIWNLMVRSAQRELRWLRYDYWDKLTRIAQGASGGGGNSTTTATAAAAMATGSSSPLIAPLPRGMASLTTSAARAAYWHELCATDSSRDLAGVLDQAITSHFGERGAAQFASTLEAFYDAGRCFAAHAAELRSVRLSWARYAKYLLLYAYRLSVQSCSEGTLIAKPQADEDGKLCAPAQHPAMMAAARGTRRAASSLALGERGRAVSSSALDLFLLDGHTLPSNSHNNNNNNNSSHQHNSSSSGSSSSNDGGVRGAVDDSAIVAGRAADASSDVTIRPHRAASALVRAPTTRAPSAWMASSAAAAAAAAAATSTPRAAPRSKSMLLLSSMHYGASASSSSSSGKDSVAARAAAAMRACTLAPVPTLGMMLLLHVHRTSHVRYLQTLSLLGIDAVDVHWHDTKAARQQTMRAWAALYDEVYTFESRDAHNNSSSSNHTTSAAASLTPLSAAAATTTTRSRTTTTPQPPSSSSARAASGASDAARDGSAVAKPAGAVAATSSDNSNNNDNNNDNNNNDDDDEEEERPAYAATYDPHCVPRTSSRLVRRSNTSNSTKERRRVVFSEGDGRFGVF